MPDQVSLAEIRARLTPTELVQGAEQVTRSAASVKASLTDLDKGFDAVGRSAKTSEAALESFWAKQNAQVAQANAYARTMQRYQEFAAANPGDARLPLILSDIKAKFEGVSEATEGSSRSFRRWETNATTLPSDRKSTRLNSSHVA